MQTISKSKGKIQIKQHSKDNQTTARSGKEPIRRIELVVTNPKARNKGAAKVPFKLFEKLLVICKDLGFEDHRIDVAGRPCVRLAMKLLGALRFLGR